MIDKIIKNIDDETGPPRTETEYIEEMIVKINEIIEWINEQDN